MCKGNHHYNANNMKEKCTTCSCYIRKNMIVSFENIVYFDMYICAYRCKCVHVHVCIFVFICTYTYEKFHKLMNGIPRYVNVNIYT